MLQWTLLYKEQCHLHLYSLHARPSVILFWVRSKLMSLVLFTETNPYMEMVAEVEQLHLDNPDGNDRKVSDLLSWSYCRRWNCLSLFLYLPKWILFNVWCVLQVEQLRRDCRMLFAVVLFSSEVWGHNQKRTLKLALYSRNWISEFQFYRK